MGFLSDVVKYAIGISIAENISDRKKREKMTERKIFSEPERVLTEKRMRAAFRSDVICVVLSTAIVKVILEQLSENGGKKWGCLIK